jgi:predicted enzyme related to lactoylglutathione lyase
MDKPKPGTIVWHDLTVDNAAEVRDFYTKVIGWKPEEVNMGDYNDYSMLSSDGQCVSGVCYRRGTNANVPPFEAGGKIIDGPRKMGGQDFCIVQDPAGAVIALITV